MSAIAKELPVVVGVDGSEPSLRAVDWASDEAVLRGRPLRLVYASLWERYEGDALAADLGKPPEEVSADDIVEAAARRARSRHPELTTAVEVVPEEPEYALIRESRSATLLVTGTRGRSGLADALLGSVSLAVAGHAHCPVIVVRGNHDNQARSGRHGRVVVGVGERATVTFAFEEARRRGVPLEAIRAWRCPAHETTDHPLLAGEPARLHAQQAVEILDKALQDLPAGVETHRRTVEGRTRTVLVAASYDADLLVVGAKRRQGHFGLQLGRIAHGVLHQSACPVVVVPEQR
ncbi:universal stress protein [Streptomyces sp. BK205]|uniref:universal stress protein n=1 Tax=Streptomyces sp. BK205 TaxID=2512164 RepID=UPI00104F2AF2|nr:universal stress protein [Streptomyces sp. BK205]TCR26274.1 nucleotide-binding universal stress UspA family protein [Streptomyces sp. BK205]